MANKPTENQVKATTDRIAISWAIDPKGKVSSTGKSTVHYSTGGFQEIEGTNLRYNLVVISSKGK